MNYLGYFLLQHLVTQPTPASVTIGLTVVVDGVVVTVVESVVVNGVALSVQVLAVNVGDGVETSGFTSTNVSKNVKICFVTLLFDWPVTG